MSNVASLPIFEGVDIAHPRLVRLMGDLGQQMACNVMLTALDQLALTLCSTIEAAMAGELAQVSAHAEQMSRSACRMGMISLSNVALDVAYCAEMRDLAGLSSTSARLQRVATLSFRRIQELLSDSGE